MIRLLPTTLRRTAQYHYHSYSIMSTPSTSISSTIIPPPVASTSKSIPSTSKSIQDNVITTTNSNPIIKKSKPKKKKKSTTTTTKNLTPTSISTPSPMTTISTSIPINSTASNKNLSSSFPTIVTPDVKTNGNQKGIGFKSRGGIISGGTILTNSTMNTTTSTSSGQISSKRGVSNFAQRTLDNVNLSRLEIRTIPSDSDGGVEARGVGLGLRPLENTRREGDDEYNSNTVPEIKVVVPTNDNLNSDIILLTSNQKKKNKKVKKRDENGNVIQEESKHLPNWRKEQQKDEMACLKVLNYISGGTISEEIQKLYQAQKATPDALKARRRLIEELNRIFNEAHFWFGHPQNRPLTIEAFGSVRFGLATSSSDLDLCLFDPYRPNGFEEKFYRTGQGELRLPDIYDMRTIAKVLNQEGFSKVVPIPHAGVPIVKFEANVGGHKIQADINTNERLGVLNSRLIEAYCNLHPLVRPLSVFIKFWAKQRRLNDPSGNLGQTTFSSYTIILLVIAYLQSIKLLPNLQDPELIELKQLNRKAFWSKPRVKHSRGRSSTFIGFNHSIGWDITFVENLIVGVDWKSSECELKAGEKKKTLEDLVKGFFSYYTEFQPGEEEKQKELLGNEGNELNHFDFNTQVVSINQGTPLLRMQPYFDLYSQKDAFNLTPSTSPPPQSNPTTPQQNQRQLSTNPPLPIGTIIIPSKDLNDDLDPAEIRRQESEDDALLALAQSIVPDELSSNGEGLISDTRASSPMEYGDFVEPKNWNGRCIVQDPFLVERNTAGNIEGNAFEMLQTEMQRALTLLNSFPSPSIKEICNPITLEPDYQALQASTREKLNYKKNQREAELIRANEKKALKAQKGLKLNLKEGKQLNAEQMEDYEEEERIREKERIRLVEIDLERIRQDLRKLKMKEEEGLI